MKNERKISWHNKDDRQRVGLGLVMALGLIFFFGWWWLHYKPEAAFIKKSPEVVASAQLYKLAFYEKKFVKDKGRPPLDWDELIASGFEPDEKIRLQLVRLDINWGEGRLYGYWALAQAEGSPKVFYYSSFAGREVEQAPEAAPLSENYHLTIRGVINLCR